MNKRLEEHLDKARDAFAWTMERIELLDADLARFENGICIAILALDDPERRTDVQVMLRGLIEDKTIA